MAARKRAKTDSTTDRDIPGRMETTPTDPSWRIVAFCAVLLVIYLWLHADALRLLLGGFASR
ncbi:MAG: hypothetical protein ABIK85_03905 [Candidatus Eisenbacteria bacterium]